MNNSSRLLVVAAGLLAMATVHAQAPAAAPAGSTGQCKDGTYSNAAKKSGACSGHHGVQEWYGASPAAPAPAAATAPAAASAAKAAPAAAAAAPAAAAAAAPAPTPAAAPAKPAAAASTKTANSTKVAAPGGGPGLVWVNPKSKTYHCQGTAYYGTTKQGSYMSEADAKAAGNHADHGKACQ